ncbi:ADP-ribosyltransferase [Actinoplanes sp. NBRC 101535]|uniref:ADP-ribosyltransferase n=1 Tax=Actinoplanes sp. NBRC 101535 TaxID=3032196 RepID=UPI0024A3E80B|nr:ADP-ribosyltransferase [Actinoplanes sp. NBRC 101535]GLY08245.1 hypothetical protein Acsp01_86240 [Actinoplanes sp. NBRC 101535]
MAAKRKATWNPAAHPRDSKGRFIRSATKAMTGKDRKRAQQGMAGFKPAEISSPDAAGEWLQRNSAATPSAEGGAIGRYLAGGWKETNPALRSGKPVESIDQLDAAFTDLPEDIVLRRVVPSKMFNEIPGSDLVGMKMRDAAPASTSVDRPGPSAPGMVTMHIAAPAGTKAYINDDAGEVLLARDTEIAITGATENPAGGWDLHGVVIPRTDTPAKPKGKGKQDDGDQDTTTVDDGTTAAPGSEDTNTTTSGDGPASAPEPEPANDDQQQTELDAAEDSGQGQQDPAPGGGGTGSGGKTGTAAPGPAQNDDGEGQDGTEQAPEDTTAGTTLPGDAPAPADADEPQPDLTADEYRAQLMKLRVPELKEQMRERGLKPGRMRKAQLVDALIEDEMGPQDDRDRDAAPTVDVPAASAPETPSTDRDDSQPTEVPEPGTPGTPGTPAAADGQDDSAPQAPEEQAVAPADQIMDAIHDALTADGRKPGDLVPLAKVRDQLPGMSREDTDAELRRLDRERRIRLEPDPARNELSQDELDAAIVIGPEAKHLISTNEPDRRGDGEDGPATQTTGEPAADEPGQQPVDADSTQVAVTDDQKLAQAIGQELVALINDGGPPENLLNRAFDLLDQNQARGDETPELMSALEYLASPEAKIRGAADAYLAERGLAAADGTTVPLSELRTRVDVLSHEEFDAEIAKILDRPGAVLSASLDPDERDEEAAISTEEDEMHLISFSKSGRERALQLARAAAGEKSTSNAVADADNVDPLRPATAGDLPGDALSISEVLRGMQDNGLSAQDTEKLGQFLGERMHFADPTSGITASMAPNGVRVLSDQIMVTLDLTNADGDNVGQAIRAFALQRGEEPQLFNELLRLHKTVQGSGFANRFAARNEQFAAAHGFTKVGLSANLDVGGYAWARAGFDFANTDSAESIGNDAAGLIANRGKDGTWDDATVTAMQGLVDRTTQAASLDEMPTPMEWAMVGWTPESGSGRAAMWPGKQLMLDASWSGVKRLDTAQVTAPKSAQAEADPRPVTWPQLWHAASTKATAASIRNEGLKVGDGSTYGAVFGRGIYLSTNKDAADLYYSEIDSPENQAELQFTAQSRVKNPFRVDVAPDGSDGTYLLIDRMADEGLAERLEDLGPEEITARLKAAGYDSVYVHQPVMDDELGAEIGGSQLVIFDAADVEITPTPGTAENQLPAAPPAPAPEAPADAGVPDVPTVQPGGPLPRVMSTQPLSDNKWGVDPDSPVAFHADGEIGQAVGMLGDDRMLDVDGLPLAEHLGRLATDTVMGRLPAQAQLDQLKTLAGRLPDGPGKRAVQLAVIGLDAPDGPAPEVPDSTPDALRKLMDQLWAIPLVRRDGMETDALSQALAKWDKGGMSGRRLADQVRQKAHNRRHESREGKLEIDTAVARAVADLEAQYADPDRRDDLKPDVIRDKHQQGLSAGEGAVPQTAPETPSGPAPSETTVGTGLPTPAQPAVPAPASAEIDRAAVSAAIPKGPHRPGSDLTDDQRAGLEGYQDSRNGTDFKQINGALRTGGPGNAQTQQAIAGIDDAMTGSELNADITVLRGVRQSRAMFGDRLDGDLTGMRWREDGFLSTSTDTGAIAPFSRGEDPVQMRVAVPAGTKAIDLYDPRDPSEAEILIDRGHEIEVVTDRGVVDGIRQIDVRVLPKAGAGQQAGKQEAAPAPARAGGNGTAVPAGQETPAAGPAPGGVVSGGMTASGWDAAAKKAAQGQGGLDSVPVRFGSGVPISVPSGWSESQSAVIGDALATYQGEAFSEINSYLRGTADGGPEITDVVKKIDDAMAASPLPKDVLVYRTIKDPGKIFGDAWGPDVTGMEWEDSAFASTTADVRVASQFAQVAQMEEPDMPPVMMRILLPKGSPGVQVSPMGRPDEVWLDFQHEAEILTARGQRRRVVADHGVDENGIRVLDIEVIA